MTGAEDIRVFAQNPSGVFRLARVISEEVLSKTAVHVWADPLYNINALQISVSATVCI